MSQAATTAASLLVGDVPEKVDATREGVSADLAAHVRSVRRQVSEHADLLAGDDPTLRAQLRHYEGGRS